MTVDWEKIRNKLPTDRTAEQKAKRNKLFAGFDPNGNGYLSLAEVDKGCKDVLDLPEIYENKSVMMRAFQAAKVVNNARPRERKSDLGDDYIERSEFRLLLIYLRNYFEVWQMFDRIDSGDDRRINLDEFKTAVSMIEGWGVKIENAEETFDEIDGNDGGQILFDEFADWVIKKGLDLGDDDDFEADMSYQPSSSVGAKSKKNSTQEKIRAKTIIDWDKIRKKLPTEKTAEQKLKRNRLFDGFDPNGNGYLSLAEVDKGCKDVIDLPEIHGNKPVMMRAFQAAKDISKSSSELGDDFIERSEFRLFLVYLRNYLEIWQMFDRIDSGDDRRINLEEFKAAVPMIERWGVKIEDAEATFGEIDDNDGGQILFDEFSHWAIKKGLDLEDDDD
jgi:Ca2+-binding EF-hand superfamily protein